MDLEEKVADSIRILKNKALISNLLIGLSGGKDSLCLCELVKMAGITNVKYFHMEFLPNLRIEQDLLAYPIVRFNIPEQDIIKVPSEHFIKCMHSSVFTWYSEQAKKDFPNCSRTDIYKSILKNHKGTIVIGVKKCDSLMMQRMVNKNAGLAIYPMKEWNLNDVLTFMKLRHIDIPPLTKKGCRGVGLEDTNLLFIYDNYPDDFERLERVFPFIRVVPLKYKYFDLHRSMRIV